MDSSHKQIDTPEPASLRRLRQLVTALTVTLILGMIILVGLMVFQIGRVKPQLVLPEQISLPRGETLTGVSTSPDWVILITRQEGGGQNIHIVKSGTAEIFQSVRIESAD